MPQLLRAVVWSGIEVATMEYFGLWGDGYGRQLRGTIVGVIAGRPTKVQYGMTCDREWRTRTVHVGMRAGGPEQVIHLTSDESHRWESAGRGLPDLEGCIDIDLALTPATNTLPIRRLGLAMGETRSVTAAWIRFPDLSIQPLRQSYTRSAEHRYHYESGTGFAADLEVDDLGLVRDYPGGWRRESSVDAS